MFYFQFYENFSHSGAKLYLVRLESNYKQNSVLNKPCTIATRYFKIWFFFFNSNSIKKLKTMFPQKKKFKKIIEILIKLKVFCCPIGFFLQRARD